MSNPFDYCQNCNVNCCVDLSGLKVTPRDFELLFKAHRDKMDVKDNGAYLQISARNGEACPVFDGEKCSMYEDRPMECRLYPYTVEDVIDDGEAVRAEIHATVRCPSLSELLPTPEVAQSLTEDFLKECYPDRDIKVVFKSYSPMHLKAHRAIRKILKG